MRYLLNKIKSILWVIFLIPFIIYSVFVIYRYSKNSNIHIINFFADQNWFNDYLDKNIKKGYEICTGVWILVYIAYLLFK
jgi:hypothetical protein